ncbi:hypothetical protein NUW58_g1188 [Xylaria curta]|uniref:Uncharacterized protein n=2 Tax=Xylaria curta TaxID=42375 RepID=A0ACC1PMI3_9PEZI|nr:hypothetical protein NUW58_g1697 [Xylaria curta]KAJ2995731.1 hypothetical protein NUW58_g1188 [Xylaria curta]
MSIAQGDVYTGMWTDWSKNNQVLGSTITLTSSDSRLLAAFLALFVSLSVSYLWLLVVYSIHRARYKITTGKCRAIVRQQQVLLKAGLTPASTTIRLVRLYWAYRFTPFAWKQSWLWISISAVSAASSVAAGLFSSKIIDSSLYINALTQSSNCGYVSLLGVSGRVNDSTIMAFNQQRATLVDSAATYARDCYNSTSDKSQCNFFPSTTIPWETNWEAECPFENICLGPAVRLDTGLLNSNSLFGINSPVEDQIEIRKITTCAPIIQKGFTEVRSDGIVQYFYGSSPSSNATKTLDTLTSNLTYAYTMSSSFYDSGLPPERNLWSPISKMNNTEGDGTVIFISSNNVRFTESCDDPIFSAHVPQDGEGFDWYEADNLAGVLGCLEQVSGCFSIIYLSRRLLFRHANVQITNAKYQVCNTPSNTCSAIGGLRNKFHEATGKMLLTPMQAGTANVTANVLGQFSRIPIVTNGNARHLVASQSQVVDEIQLPLPSNQWQIEVQFWHATVMSLIQHSLLEFMIGPNNAALQKYIKAPITSEERAVCKRQRVRISQGFANVSSLGLFFTIGLGTVVIILALFLDNIMGCITRFSKGDEQKHRAWIRDDVLHLQRLAYTQEKAFGPRWIATDDNDIPSVEDNSFLDPIVDPQEVKPDKIENRLSVDSLMDVDGTP